MLTTHGMDDRVSRRRYEREVRAREEAERLLDAKSRELYDANQALQRQTVSLEAAVQERTKDLQEAKQLAEKANQA